MALTTGSKMKQQELIQVLREFTSGKRPIVDVEDALWQRLEDSRENGAKRPPTEEEGTLWELYLYVTEFKEGFRPIDDVHSLIKSIIRPSPTIGVSRS
jgi:hypothetical protein